MNWLIIATYAAGMIITTAAVAHLAADWDEPDVEDWVIAAGAATMWPIVLVGFAVVAAAKALTAWWRRQTRRREAQ